jgi:ATP-dependent Clp protease ATP-binding subunit ClpB
MNRSILLITTLADPNLEDHYYPRSHQEANVRQEDFSSELLPYRDYRKFTALHYACIIQNPDMVGLLLDHMADPTARTAQGLTPREYLYYVERFTGEKNLKIESALRG